MFQVGRRQSSCSRRPPGRDLLPRDHSSSESELTMGHFQENVTEYLRADRATFVNTECLIQLDPGDIVSRGTHWYCDAVAVNFRESAVFLCEVTYSASMGSLVGRLQAWASNWEALCRALRRDSCVPSNFAVCPWVFIPKSNHRQFERKLSSVLSGTAGPSTMPTPRVTYLESVVPWNYPSWDRKLTELASSPSASVETEG